MALEAWAAGLPVLAAKVGGLKDFIVSGRNGVLFDPEDAASLVREYDRLTADEGLRKQLAATALADVRNYSWEALTGRLLDLYGELRHG